MTNPEEDFIELGDTGYVPVKDGVLDLATGEVIEYDDTETLGEEGPDKKEPNTTQQD